MDKNKSKLIEKNLASYSGGNPVSLDKEMELIKKYNVDIVTIDDERYPENLKHIYSPPPVLYVKGNLLPEDYYNIAIVGSRRASLYGRETAEKLARQLCGRGFTVTSGMARGIDTSAHTGVLKAAGRTIAVLGCGINIVYPPENKNLMDKIADSGAVISEFPINTTPHRHNFPIRNRIISGLALGVVIVEAAQKSGALITASFALEQGREVFSVPGKVGVPTSRGTLGLIKEGAKLVEDVEDILEEIRSKPSAQATSRVRLGQAGTTTIPHPTREMVAGLTEDEASVFNSLSEEPKHIDEIKDI
ncbi:MAG: DNA-processing protein DprA, partial [Candidatus Omnitrophica bacterium]|nr:DNA-processing protein DprA [Candidatus Omnitrophota bacterium]